MLRLLTSIVQKWASVPYTSSSNTFELRGLFCSRKCSRAYTLVGNGEWPDMSAMQEQGQVLVDAGAMSIPEEHKTGTASASDWRKALQKVAPCCVVLKVTQTRSLDTEAASSAYATGFIVDKERGIILTNRHVVTPGPITAEAIFLNREELQLLPVYYDPVHDFGFLRFNPAKLQYMEIGEVALAPEAAHMGLEIRVVGNDSGEKVSILAGTLARLDRDAPYYGRKGYNDFNTFYMQAASGTKGGSSGSPVIDSQGRAVGLNAGGKNKAQSAYYLPLNRVVRALEMVKRCYTPGEAWESWRPPSIPRGDLQATFLYKGFDEVRRLGLRQETEAMVREAAANKMDSVLGPDGGPPTGMLVVDSVVPQGPSHELLQPGDILVRVEGQLLTHFLPMEVLLDAKVSQEVTVDIERGGTPMSLKIRVQDLQEVTPSLFLEVGGATLHSLSYQQARNNRLAVGQVYVAEAGYLINRAAVPKYAVLTKVDNQAVDHLDDFIAVLTRLRHGSRIPVEYYTFSERHRRRTSICYVDWLWYGPPRLWRKNSCYGVWDMVELEVPQAQPLATLPAPGLQAVNGDATGVAGRTGSGETGGSDGLPPPPLYHGDLKKDTEIHEWYEDNMKRCQVLIDIDIPLIALADGVHARNFTGNGLIVYHSERLGLVLVDRNTAVVGPCDVLIQFGAFPAEISGRIRFMHPLHNFCIISYNPQDLPPEARREIRSARLLPDPPLKKGDRVHLVGLTKSLRVMRRDAVVTTATAAINIPHPEVPRFRAVHEEVVKLDQDFGMSFSGVLTNDLGHVRGLWGSYAEQIDREEREWCAGLPAYLFAPWVDQMRLLDSLPPQVTGPPTIRTLDAELEPLLLSKARQFGLPQQWVSMLNQLDSERRQVLRIKSCVAGSGASGTLKDGDMVLMVGNEPVSCFADVERIVANYRVETKSTGEVIAGEKRSSPYAAEVPGAPVKRLRQGEANGIAVAEGRQPLEEASMTVAPGLMLPGNQVAVAPEQMQVFCDAALADFAKVRRARAFYYNTSPYRENAADLPSIPITIYREQSIQTVHVTPGLEDGLGTNRLVHWCGAQIQEPHRAVRELGWMPEDHGAYISRWHHGSPAHRYGLYALHWILAVNDEPISDLDTFVREVTRLRDGDFVRVKVCHLETTKPKVLTLKLDLRYWPTWELRLDRDESVWRRHLLQHPGQEEVLRTSFETLQRDGWDAVLGRPVGDASTA